MRAVHCLAAAALVLGAVGCAVPKGAGFPDVAKTIEERTGAKVHWFTGSEEDAKVDKLVDDLLEKKLDAASAVQIALLRNPGLQATYEELGVAQADVVQAGLLRNPRVGASVRFPFGAGLRPVDIGVAQDFLSAFLIPAKKRLAEAEFERVKLAVSQEVLDVATRARVAFLSCVAARQKLALGKAVLDAAKASTEAAQRQPDASGAGELASVTERSAYERVLLDVARLEGQANDAREELLVVMGLFGPQAASLQVPDALDDLPAQDPPLEKVEQTAIEARFDVAAARRGSEVTARAIDLAKAGRYTAILDLGIDFSREEGKLYLGPSAGVTLPIFDQGQALIFALEARKRAADQRLFAVSIEARSDARRQKARVLLARQIVDRFRTVRIPVADRAVALSEERRDTTPLGALALLLARRDAADARGGHVDALRDYWVARAELDRALGGRPPEATARKDEAAGSSPAK